MLVVLRSTQVSAVQMQGSHLKPLLSRDIVQHAAKCAKDPKVACSFSPSSRVMLAIGRYVEWTFVHKHESWLFGFRVRTL
jgi:hypothetical protein